MAPARRPGLSLKLHDPDLHARVRDGLLHSRGMVEELVRQAIADGHIDPDRDPAVETDLLLSLTGFTALLELNVVEPPGRARRHRPSPEQAVHSVGVRRG
jgi:hypothetical protein